MLVVEDVLQERGNQGLSQNFLGQKGGPGMLTGS